MEKFKVRDQHVNFYLRTATADTGREGRMSVRTLAVGLSSPCGAPVLLPNGGIILSDTQNNQIKVVSSDGAAMNTFSGEGSGGWCDGAAAVAQVLFTIDTLYEFIQCSFTGPNNPL